MKFQIDTTAKTIKLEESASVVKLLNILKSMFPDDWEDYKILTNTTIVYTPYRSIFWNGSAPILWGNTPYTTNSQYTLLSGKTNLTSSYTTSCNSKDPNIINVTTTENE